MRLLGSREGTTRSTRPLKISPAGRRWQRQPAIQAGPDEVGRGEADGHLDLFDRFDGEDRVRRLRHPAGIEKAPGHEAGDRGQEARLGESFAREVKPGAGQGGLCGGGAGAGLGILHLPAGDHSSLEEAGHPGLVGGGLGGEGFGLVELGLRLGGLKGVVPVLDRAENRAGVDPIADSDGDVLHAAGDLGEDVHPVPRLDGAGQDDLSLEGLPGSGDDLNTRGFRWAGLSPVDAFLDGGADPVDGQGEKGGAERPQRRTGVESS